MRFKIDKNLNRIAAAKATRPETMAVELCRQMIDAGVIEDSKDYWGMSVLLATGPQYVSDICDMLSGFLYGDETHSIPADIFDAFCALTIIGDFDCPYCGGELEFVETEGHELNDGSYYTPNSYIVDNYIYKCRECGEIIKSEKEL